MKKFNKNTAIILSILMFVVLAIGFVFSYVPLQFSKGKFVSLSKTVNISTDLVGGLYGEYNITTESPSQSDIIDSVSLIREVFEDDGYKNVNVYAVGNKKVRVELSFPNGDETFQTAFAKLTNVGTGAFSISTVDPTSSSESETVEVTLEGSKYVKEVNVYTQDGGKYISIVFNKAGKAKFKEVCQNASSSQIYLVLGDYSQPITIDSSLVDFSSLTLQNTDWENTIALEQKIRLGCTKVELDGANATINTMSATLSSGESASTTSEKSFYSSKGHGNDGTCQSGRIYARH